MAYLKQHVLTLLRCRLLWRIALLTSIAAIVFLATTADSYPVPASSSDKVNHLVAFLELTLLTRLSWPETRVLVFAPALLLFGLALESVQAGLPYRDFSLADLVADGVGITLGLLPWPGLRWAENADLRKSPKSL